MNIIAQCPKCGNTWLLNEQDADKKIRCPECYIIFKVPNLDEVPKAMKIIKKAKGRIYVDQDGKIYG